MPLIVVAPERLEATAHTFEAKKAEVEGILRSLQQTLVALDGEWDGVAQTKFYAHWNETVPQMQRFAELLGEIAAELRRIAQAFREVDQRVI